MVIDFSERRPSVAANTACLKKKEHQAEIHCNLTIMNIFLNFSGHVTDYMYSINSELD